MTGTDVVVRLLTHDDLDDALALSSTAGWNQRIDDWRMLLDLAPAGSFAAVSGDRIVGTAIGIEYGSFSWIAMMLVEPAYRGRGLGRRLLEAAIDAVPADTPVRLDATPMGRPLYHSYGFVDEALLTRCASEVSRRQPDGSELLGTRGIRSLTPADLPGAVQEDEQAFGGRRRELLAWTLGSAPEYAHVLTPAGEGEPIQFCFGRRGRLFDQIGPVVAASDEAAQTLTRAALQAAPTRAVVMDVFAGRGGFAAWLQARGFQAQRPLFRMRRPPRRQARAPGVHQQSPLSEFAILGPEFA